MSDTNNNPEWQPKFPDFARDLRQGKLVEAEREHDDQNDSDWVPAPPDSHVHSFKFEDSRRVRVLKLGGFSYILVRFKNPRGPMTRYTYSFSNPNQAAEYWARLTTDDHPGKVIQDMIAARIPYERNY